MPLTMSPWGNYFFVPQFPCCNEVDDIDHLLLRVVLDIK